MTLIQALDQRSTGRHSRVNGWRTPTMNSNKRQATNQLSRTDAQDGAEEAGRGLEVTMPKAVPHGYNNNYTVRLTYADNYRADIGQAGNSANTQIFRTNGIFDPDFSGTGHQPLFRDMWASMYDYYTVLACDYTIRMYNASGQDPVTFTAAITSAQNIGAVNVSVFPTTNSTDYSSAASGLIYPAAEFKNTHTEFLTPGEKMEFKGTLTPGDFIVDAKDSDNDTTWIANGSNPSVPRFLGYVISPAQWTALVGVNELPVSSIQIQVILHYTVQFTQVNQTLRTVPS